jgi:hypothetical protein
MYGLNGPVRSFQVLRVVDQRTSGNKDAHLKGNAVARSYSSLRTSIEFVVYDVWSEDSVEYGVGEQSDLIL